MDKENIMIIPDILVDSDIVIYQMLFNFMYTGWLVLPSIVSEETLMGLIMLGDYFCVERLAQICCNQLTSMISVENVKNIMNLSSQFKNLDDLTVNCSDFWIKKQSLKLDIEDIEMSITEKSNSKNVSLALQ